MEETSSKRENFKMKVKSWLKNKYNLTFLFLIIFIIAVRLYYFILTKNQPLWWDEAEYLATAKSFAGINHFDFQLALNRFPGFPLLVAFFYIIGITNEVVLRFLVAFLPSIIAITLLYFVLTSMYKDKRIALISLAIFSLLWEHLFFSNRFMTENLSLIFEFLAIIVLFKVYLSNQDWKFIKSKYALLWIALFAILCILFRAGNMVFIPIVILFLILVNFYRIPEKFRFASYVGLIAIAVLGFISTVFLSHRFAFFKQFYQYAAPLDWSHLSAFYIFYQSFIPWLPSVLLYCFLIGVIVVLGTFLIFPEGLKRIKREVEDNRYNADIFNILLILGFLFFFIVMLRPGGVSSRWLFVIIPGLFAFTAKGLIKFADFIQSIVNIKYLSFSIIVLILCLGVYTQFNHADGLIKNKLESYSQVRDSGLWIRDNSNPGDVIVSASLPQHRYYSERTVLDFYAGGSNENESAFDAEIAQYKPKYLVLSAFESAFTPSWAYTWPERHNNTVMPVQAYSDAQNPKQPILIIYELKK